MQEEQARDIAKRLLARDAKWAVSFESDQMDLVRRPIRELLADDGLAEHLFSGLAPSRAARVETYGFGNQDIDVDFADLRGELRRLAHTGRYDREILSRGEEVLRSLIAGVGEAERDAKGDVNPNAAEEKADIFRALQGVETSRRKATPNEIDAMQTEALFSYEASKHCRNALEVILEAVGQINRSLDREGPDRGRCSGR